jgi:hypothetical protein
MLTSGQNGRVRHLPDMYGKATYRELSPRLSVRSTASLPLSPALAQSIGV